MVGVFVGLLLVFEIIVLEFDCVGFDRLSLTVCKVIVLGFKD